MDYVILKQYDQVCSYVGEVSSIADKNKNSFGFLSASVYEQMASKGRLWVAVNKEKDLKGYLIFGGTMPTLKVFQIYVCDSVKGCGVGRLLINYLKEYATKNHYHTISARVASDLPANTFWEKVGFAIHRQVKGGEATKRTINIRGCSLESNDLLGGLVDDPSSLTPSRPILIRPVYALDLNLLLDIVKQRQGHEKVTRIMKVGFQGGFSICITPEFKRELERQSANFPTDPVLKLAEAFPELKAEGDIPSTADSLREIVFPHRSPNRKAAENDESDLIHLAYCVLSGVGGFVTREKALLRACDALKDKFNLAVISPDELIFDDGDTLDVSSPMNSDFSLSASIDTPEVRSFLQEFSAPEVVFDRLFSTSPVEDGGTVYEARLDGNLFGVYFFQKPIKSTKRTMAFLYVDESSPKAMAAIDHFLETALRYKSGFSYRLDLYIGQGQVLTEETLLRKGFFKAEGCFCKIICSLFLCSNNWGGFAREIKSLCGFSISNKFPSKKELSHTGVYFTDSTGQIKVLSWFDFETMISPRFILSYERECVLVPIRENYANGLIGNVTSQLSLLPSHDKILLLEKAYFRSSSKSSLFKKGRVVAFYISGYKSIQEIIGFARITYSDVVTIDEAVVKVDRQGVLSYEELVAQTDRSGKLHVFTFDNFLEFDRRIPFRQAKQLGVISNANLASPEKIGIAKLKILIEAAFDE
ncbi:hypothetical protein L861_23295 [Litchfieldella anticariensis FP35 = DSM 16096]|uniref:N-acetyltransferase domain-containing protein n=1 Tax=Litchfieldella anticariensis (strain DSM 16096 / CECT 5854 / CIP 108499 / LMG 22089 / FP35) TaxID=1121939 RepID=S2KRV5_LITA3|nr:GNAT family N-acetyltransferase [Halomonas anticariensis]EPC03238.1 hypothetical protein L861_23295 [Halomonas anticariensis FP35 = DSM 16096]